MYVDICIYPLERFNVMLRISYYRQFQFIFAVYLYVITMVTLGAGHIP